MQLAVGFLQFGGSHPDPLLQLEVEPAEFFHQLGVGSLDQIRPRRLPHGMQDLVVFERLEQVVLDPAAVDGVDRVFEPAEAGHHDADGVRGMQADVFEQLHAALTGQLLVGEDNVDRPFGEDAPGRLRGIGGEYLEFGVENLGKQIPDGLLVVNDQDRTAKSAHGGRSLRGRGWHNACRGGWHIILIPAPATNATFPVQPALGRPRRFFAIFLQCPLELPFGGPYNRVTLQERRGMVARGRAVVPSIDCRIPKQDSQPVA